MKFKYMVSVLFSIFLFSTCAAQPNPTTSPETNPPIFISQVPQATPTFYPSSATSDTVIETTITLAPTKTQEPITEAHWKIPAQKLIFNKSYAFNKALWNEYEILLFQLGDTTPLMISSNTLQVITPTPEPSPTPTKNVDEIIVVGPEGYRIKCVDTGLQMLDAEINIIATTEITGNFCDDAYYANNWLEKIAWTSTKGGAFAFLDEDRNIYIWEISDLTITHIGQTDIWTYPSWNPAGTQILARHSYPEDAGYWGYVLAYRDGREQKNLQAKLSTRTESFPKWLSNEIIEQYSQCASSCATYEYFQAATGTLLTGYSVDHLLEFSDFAISAYPWILLPQVSDWPNSRQYQLYNFETLIEYKIASWPEYQFDLVGWSENSRTFLLIREPAELDHYVYSSDITYGYLRFYPETQDFEWILKNALYIEHREDYFFAITINPEKQSMSAGLYDAIGGFIAGDLIYSDHILLTDDEDYYRFRDPFSWAWSHDGHKIVYADYQGNIWLLNIDGTEALLGENLDIKDWPYFTKEDTWYTDAHQLFVWSPDDTQILTILNGEAWILTP